MIQMMWLQLLLDHFVKGEKAIPNTFIRFRCVSLAIRWPSITICSEIGVREHQVGCNSEQIRILLANRRQSLFTEYATNCTHHIPLLNSLSFHVDLFVYLIMLRTGQFLPSFHDLSQMRFLCVISSNSSIGMGCLLHVACVKCLVLIFDFRVLLGMDRIMEFVSLRVPKSLEKRK